MNGHAWRGAKTSSCITQNTLIPRMLVWQQPFETHSHVTFSDNAS